MKKNVFILLLSLSISIIYSQDNDIFDSEEDKTLSPYFIVKTNEENPDIDYFPLQSTNTEINIVGVIADVKVKQVYKNQGKVPIEAIYVFPGSTRAAVYGMRMKIGERIIKAVIEKKKEAKEKYEKAKSEGKSASLLEQMRPNVFQMNVANIMPGDEIEVELSYTELVLSTNGIYEFVFPTVVGPRYSNQKESEAKDNDKWVQNPYLHEKEEPTYNFYLSVNISSGIPVSSITSTSHNINTKFESSFSVNVSLSQEELKKGNKDFILKYSLLGEKIETGLMLYKGEEENFFLFMAEPPKRISDGDIVPREYIFILDVSGSMSGFPINTAKRLIRNLVENLNEKDKFNIIFFAGASSILSERGSLAATDDNLKKAIKMIDKVNARGGTELLPALKQALKLKRDENTSATMVIITDGYVNIEEKAFDLIRINLGNSNFFAFGIGSSVNRYLIEGIAKVGKGEPFIVTNESEAIKLAEKFREYIQYPILTKIDITFEDFDAYDIEPMNVPDLFAQRPLIIYGKWKGKPQGEVSISGIAGKDNYESILDIASIKSLESKSALKYLWARKRIELLSDFNLLSENDARVNEITSLSLKYNLLSKYTSFIAVDEVVRNKEKDYKSVKQPLPLPEGVTDNAVGTVPEPHEWALFIVIVFTLLFVYRKRLLMLLNGLNRK